MKKRYPIILFASLVCFFTSLKAQNSLAQVEALQHAPKVYAAKKINSNIEVDGKMESIWNTAPWSSEFIDIEGVHKPKPTYQTQYKILWDDENLYIYAKLREPHVWGTLQKHDAIIYHDNDFELFLKPNLGSPIYYEIEVNTLNTIMDLMMPKPYRMGGQAVMHWDVKNLKSAVHIEGTLNDPTDKDNYWAIEIAIPFGSLQKFGNSSTPKINSFWRINFSRVQWQHEVNDSTYSRKKLNGKHIPENNWVWSPIGLVNMHYPERWGFLHFVQNEESTELPPFYEIEKTAWNIHYLQHIHKNKQQNFTSNLTELEGFSTLLKKDLDKYEVQITLSSDKKFYHMIFKEKNSKHYFTIDSYGNYTTNYE
jgi:hypothetical protein